MNVYTVHVGQRDPAEPLLVKEGFCWPAALVSVLWALWSRMWGEAVGLMGINLLLILVLSLFDTGRELRALISLGVAAVIGFAGNDLRRRHLVRKGYAEVGVVTGRNAEEALHRYLSEGGPK